VFVSFNMFDPQLGMHRDPAIADRHRALRCAISKAYSWQERSDKIYGGQATLFQGVIPPNVAGFKARHLQSQFDLEGAKALLKQHGYDANTLPKLKFGSTANPDQRRAFELFRAQMVALGFPAERIEWQSFPSFGAYIDAINRGEVMLMDLGWQLDAPDAENVMQLYYGPYKAPQVNNANYTNAQFDTDFERVRSMANGPERLVILQRMNQQLIDDCVVISGAVRRGLNVWRKPWIVWPDSHMMAGRALRFVGQATP
jgi:oligopeptide transport system substrate-binding protein